MIGKRLADARKRAHLTQPDVVNRLALLGVTCQAQAISKWEKGETVPTAYNLIALMIALEIHEGFAYFSGALEENPVRLNVTGISFKHTFPLNLAFVRLSLFGIGLSFVYLRMKSNRVHLSASIALAPSVKNKCCSSTFSMASVVCPAISTRPDVCMPW